MNINILKEGSYVLYTRDQREGLSFLLGALADARAPHTGDDFLLVEKTTISIDDIRLFQDFHNQTSVTGQKTIVCSGAFITTQAQNALLKMIEEVKEGERFFIIIPNELELLPTILSRVQTYTIQSESKKREAEKFVNMPAHERIAYVEKTFLIIEESDEKRDALLSFFRDLEEYTYSQKNINKYEELLKALPVLRQMLSNPGAPAKMIAEYVALVF